MFWNRKKKETEKAKAGAVPEMPGFRKNADGSFSLSLDGPSPVKTEPKVVTERLYVISRGNIDLAEAQEITKYAALEHPERAENLMPDEHVDLVWCAAYPDAIFGEISLQDLLVGYVEKSEGDKYLNKSSQVIPISGTKDGNEYFILILVHLE